jgi:hypothetical protein
MRFFAIIALLVMLLGCSGGTEVTTAGKPAGESQKESAYQKEMEELRKNLKSEVKIKLKKDGKGLYSWEIQGKDAQEVLKANETLKKKLGE